MVVEKLRAICLSLVTLLVAAAPAAAQSISATIVGRVVQSSGAPVDAATVQARSLATGVVRTALTASDGRFRLDSLPPGTWEVVASAEGAPPSNAQTVTLGLQQTVRLEFKLLPALEESVEVTSDVPLIDAKRTWSELRIDGETASSLPVNNRSITDLALLDSGVQATPSGTYFGERAAVFALNGQTGRANSFLVDGLDNGDRASSTTLNSYFSQQVIKEFVVLKHQYAAEFGRAGGGVMNIITERGSNDHSGEIFVQGTSPGWNSSGDFSQSLAHDQGDRSVGREAYGFKFGGPIRKDKAFYFVAAERQTSDDILPYTGIDRAGDVGGLYRAPNQDENLFLRIDANLSDKTFLMARASGDRRESRGLNVEGIRTPEGGFALDEEDGQIAASLTHLISPRAIYELRFLVGTSDFNQRANSQRPGVERPSGIFGGNNLNRQDRGEKRLQLLDNISWTRGAHTYKVGIDLLKTRTNVRTRFNPNGNFLYITDKKLEPGDCGDLDIFDIKQAIDTNGDGTVSIEEEDAFDAVSTPVPCPGAVGVDDDGDGTIDEPGFIGTYPLVFQLIEGRPSAQLDDLQYALFWQDSWQATSRLAVDYGVRYDASTYTLGKDVRVSSLIPNGGAKRDNDNVAPRLGITWQADEAGRWLVRGGAGIFYDKVPLGFPAVSSLTSGTQIKLYFPQGLAQGITESVVEQLGIDVIKQALVFEPRLNLRFSTGTVLDTPYVVQYNAGFDRAFGTRGAFTLDLVRALGFHQTLMKDLNPVVTIRDDGLPQHADPEVGSIAAIVSEGRTWYTSATAQYRWRGQNGWASASYTWSQALDLGSDPLKGGISLPPTAQPKKGRVLKVDTQIFEHEKGRADTDRRHRVVMAAGGQLPWLGLNASATLQYASSLPFDVTTGRDENVDGLTNDRPAGVGRNTGDDTKLDSINALRRKAGLPMIESLTSQDFLEVDFRLARPYQFGAGKTKGEWFMQVFNLFDRNNVSLIEGRVTSRSFGQPLGLAGPPRTLELGVRFGF